MALMFQRIARNYAKAGFYPTDAVTTACVVRALASAIEGGMRIIDPCAGEGTALLACKDRLGAQRTLAYGVEYDRERAWSAKRVLDRVIHGDIQDCIISRRMFGLLWLNPPYGDMVYDKAVTGDNKGAPQRLEKYFYGLTNTLLQFGGVMVLIVPHYTLDGEFARWIAAHFEKVRVYLAPEQQFKQVVVFGVRKRTGSIQASATLRATLMKVGQGDLPDVLPEQWANEPYVVPSSANAELGFSYSQLEPEQLAEEIKRFPCLWEQLDTVFSRGSATRRRPLCALSNWHLALALAAGQVSGVVKSEKGRVFVIKGDTHKEKEIRTEVEELENGKQREVRTHTDRFVPVIRALDFTPDSQTFGQTITIK